jgi:predicted nucleic acid-binding protein
MSDIMVDSNILIDIFNEDQQWFSWSSKIIEQYAEQSRFVINPIIYAEISVAFKKIEELEDALPPQYFNRESIPIEAAFLVGKVFSHYRKSGGKRNSSLPDFFIGAHAAVRGMRLITRDISRYKTYFPDLQLISPE